MTASRPALLLMDFQRGIVEAASNGSEVVGAARLALAHARDSGIPVVFVAVKFRTGHIDIAASNKRLAGLKSAARLQEADPASEIVDMLRPPGP